LNYDGHRAPFLYSTNGEVIWFHDVRHKLSRSRKVNQFHTPAALRELLEHDLDNATNWLETHANDHSWLRPYQVEANNAIEKAVADRKRLMLVAMATGTEKAPGFVACFVPRMPFSGSFLSGQPPVPKPSTASRILIARSQFDLNLLQVRAVIVFYSRILSSERKEKTMRRVLVSIATLALFAMPASAQTVDEIISHYIKTIGGMEKIQAVSTLRRRGKFTGGGGFEAVVLQENKRGTSVREEFSLQGMTGINAYDGKTGWKIEPWNGKKDPESLGEEEMKSILEDSDFDGPLVNYKQKGNNVEFVGMDQFEGTDTFKLKVTIANGDVYFYYLDTDYYVPIKIDTKRLIRGAEREYETALGDYKEVAGWYLPHSIETNTKGSQDKSKVVYDKIEANAPIDDGRFRVPVVAK
jgi:hypothetical protein